MSNPLTIVNNIVSLSQQLIANLELAQQYTDMISQDSTVLTRYFQQSNARTDIVSQDVTNALAAFTQLAFTFNSGSPTQKSYLYKLTP